MNADDIMLAKFYGGSIGLPRSDRIAFLEAAENSAALPTCLPRWSKFLRRAIQAERADEAYAETAKQSRVDYWQHLASRYWKRLRAFAFVKAEWKCARCGEAYGMDLELHHRAYDKLGFESLDDVAPLCRFCHLEIHGRSR